MSIPDTTVRLLEAVSYFSDLNADILQTIAQRCQSKSLLSRRPVFMEGDPCKHLYILESGCVKFYRSRTCKLWVNPRRRSPRARCPQRGRFLTFGATLCIYEHTL